MPKQEFGPGKEFFSEWHRDAAIDGYERDALAAQARIAVLEDAESDGSDVTVAMRGVREQLANAQRELKRILGQRGAAKRPAGAEKETRG